MPSVLRLAVCVAGVYATFLYWGVLQEGLSSTTFTDPRTGEKTKFRSVVFLNTIQSAISVAVAAIYILLTRPKEQSVGQAFGLPEFAKGFGQKKSKAKKDEGDSVKEKANGAPTTNGEARVPPNGKANGAAHSGGQGSLSVVKVLRSPLLFRYIQVALFQSLASPFGFASLRYISYPTMILGKSCKLVPVMLMNVVLYRRRFAAHKYLVVSMVTIGISAFMLFQPIDPAKAAKHGGRGAAGESSILGLALLLTNLIIDGATNSTQDEIFSRYDIQGTQMMFMMNLMATLLQFITISVALPSIPVLNPTSASASELSTALAFLHTHPSAWLPILSYALCGALGQCFIFDLLAHFGSLTLVTVTVTRKLFTMLLSVFLFDHPLSAGQWAGVALVFAGIGVEAHVKRSEGLAKKALQQGEKTKLKAA